MFLLIVCGIMVANLLTDLLSSNTRILFPVWVVLCLVPAYWYGHRLGIVSYAPRDVLGTILIVLIAIATMELWGRIRPFSAITLALLVSALFLLRRRWLR
jgi:hypothetical protein